MTDHIHHQNSLESIAVFCGWGDGPDVGIHLYDADGNVEKTWDFTLEEAKQFARKLQNAIEQVEYLDAYAEQYFAHRSAREGK